MTKLKNISLFALVLLQLETIAQTQSTLLWPIKNSAPGVNIIGKPGDNISGEINYDGLYIGATDSAEVVAPIDGIISSVGYQHSFRLNFQKIKGKTFPKCESITDDEVYRNAWASIIQEQYPKMKMDISQYISYSIGIKVGADEMYYISGLRPVLYFKTGEAVKKGDILGRVGYCDTTFKTPHIRLSRSIKTKSEDPMRVFGIPSTFKKYNAIFNYNTDKHSTKNLIEAFNIMRTGLEQSHPGLYDYTPKEKMDSLFTATLKMIDKPMTSEEFRVLVTPIITEIRDVHTAIYPDEYTNEVKIAPQVSLGVVNGVLQIMNSSPQNQVIAGTQVKVINGQPADKVIKMLRSQYYRKEGYNELPVEHKLLTDFWGMYYKAYSPLATTLLKLVLENGQEVRFKYLPISTTKSSDETLNLAIKMIKPSIGYIDVNSFQLNQVEEDSILRFIQSLERNRVSNLIIDVRNNRGGNQEVLDRLTSYFIGKPYRRSCYREVKSNTTYPAFQFADNYNAKEVLFGDFKIITSKNTFKQLDTIMVTPSSTHYSRKLYILTDEFSVSAASEFAAVLAEQGVGSIIGRETGTCYYQMNAEKFVFFKLGSTGLNLMVPLIKIVSREAIHHRIPYGHGVIPDIDVPLTLEEFSQPKDVILERTLEVIAKQDEVSVR